MIKFIKKKKIVSSVLRKFFQAHETHTNIFWRQLTCLKCVIMVVAIVVNVILSNSIDNKIIVMRENSNAVSEKHPVKSPARTAAMTTMVNIYIPAPSDGGGDTDPKKLLLGNPPRFPKIPKA